MKQKADAKMKLALAGLFVRFNYRTTEGGKGRRRK